MNRRASPATDLSKSDPSERFLSRANLTNLESMSLSGIRTAAFGSGDVHVR